MSRYRILYHHRIRADDGQAVHVRELIAALREAGHEVLECALVQKSSGGDGPPSGARFWQGLSLPRRAVSAGPGPRSAPGHAGRSSRMP